MKSILIRGCFVLALLICVGLSGCGPEAAPMGGGAKGPLEVHVSLPVSREITDVEEFPGRLESDQTIQLRARVTGYLLRFNFKEGGFVNKGDVLFEIDPQLYAADLSLAEGNVLEAEGQYEQARADLRRAQQLRVPTEISAEDVNKYRGAYVVSEGKLKAARANLKKATINMAYTKVVAPIGGQVSKSALDPGNLVRADDTILTSIGASDPMKATFDLDERTLSRVLRLIKKGVLNKDFTGTPVQMWMADEDQDENPPQEGVIDFTDNNVDTTTGTFRVRGAFPNKDGLLVPGMFVRVRVPIGKPQQALLIEEKALVTDQGQKCIYVVKEEDSAHHEGTVEYRQVNIGGLHDGLRVIKEGLKPHEKVVVSGLQRVKPGIKFKFKEVTTAAPPPKHGSVDPSKSKARGDSTNISRTPPVIVPPSPAHEGKGTGKKGKGR